jgi:hypothetical protein
LKFYSYLNNKIIDQKPIIEATYKKAEANKKPPIKEAKEESKTP